MIVLVLLFILLLFLLFSDTVIVIHIAVFTNVDGVVFHIVVIVGNSCGVAVSDYGVGIVIRIVAIFIVNDIVILIHIIAAVNNIVGGVIHVVVAAAAAVLWIPHEVYRKELGLFSICNVL